MAVYRDDLAFIHDAGFSDFCRGAAPWLLRSLPAAPGLVIDLGCGSGRWTSILTEHGYRVMGIDPSAAFLRLARRNAPGAKFVRGSLWDARFAPACGVTAIGECLNYLDDSRRRVSDHSLDRLFARVFHALEPGGVLLFDVAGPARIPVNGPTHFWTEGPGWAVLVETAGDLRRRSLTRRIVSFRRVGGAFRRSEELHRLRLYEPETVLTALRRSGFDANAFQSYGRYPLPPGVTAFRARRPVASDPVAVHLPHSGKHPANSPKR